MKLHAPYEPTGKDGTQ